MQKETQGLATERFLVSLTLILILVSGGFLAFKFSSLPPELPWLYSLPWGEQQLIKKEWFAGGLVGLFLFNLINFWLAGRFKKTDPVVVYTALGAGLLVTLLYLASFWQVLRIMS